MVDINKHPLIRQAYELCHAIEACGASPKSTSAAIKASSLMSAIEKEFADDPLDLGFEVKREAGDVLIRDSDDIEWTSGVAWARSAPQTVVTMLADAYKVAVQTGHDLDYIAYTLDLAGNSDVSAICKAIKDMWGKLYVHETAQRESAAQPSQPELKIGSPCPTCGRKVMPKMGSGDYSCVSCGLGMEEPCVHWKKMLANPMEEEPATQPSDPRGAARDDVWWNRLFIERQKFIREWGNKNGYPDISDSLLDMLLKFWAEVHALRHAPVSPAEGKS